MVFATALSKDTTSHRGTLLDVARSSFAPSAALRRTLAQGAVDEETFAESYALELRLQWARDPLRFREVIEQAKAGDVTLVDTWVVGAHAPRRVLAGVLAQIARGRTERPAEQSVTREE
jgi:uncharacterized protein YeaO (DUF488 family)